MRFSVACGALSVLTLSTLSAAAGDSPAPAKVFQAREGVRHVRDKLQAGAPVTVVFLGGSITANGSGFTGLTPKWLETQFPQAKIRALNAGISGTPSRFGAQRVDRDVLAFKPDLVFVEFAVNDGENDASEDMERLVRKIWTVSPETDVVFLYTLNAATHLPSYQSGVFPKAASSHERVANHYGIPSIGIGGAAAEKILAGTLRKEDFAADGVHPSPQGYAVYQEAIEKALAAMLAEKSPARTRTMPEPLTPQFVLYKEPPKLEPMPVPDPLELGDGRQAAETFVLPQIGKHWANEPVYSVNEQPLWRLRELAWDKARPTAEFGRDSRQWKDGVKWFPEAGVFCGSSGKTRLLGPDENGLQALAATTPEVPVLEFIAPRDGTYHFALKAPKVEYFGPPERTAMINVFHLPWGVAEAVPVAHAVWVKSTGGPVSVNGQAVLRAGESLAFVLAKDSQSRPSLPGIDLRIGRAP